MIPYQVHVEQVALQLTGVVRRRASLAELANVIPQGCGEVWDFMRASSLPHPGRNLAFYLDDQINLECGVEVPQPFASDGPVILSSLPAGRVATTAHFGSYDRLSEAHAAIQSYCRAHNLALSGPSWEVYGHWDDDPARLRTDVFYLLAGPAGEVS